MDVFEESSFPQRRTFQDSLEQIPPERTFMKSLLLTASLISFAAVSTASAHDVSVSNEDVVKQIYADFADGNMEGFATALSPDIVWNEAENNPYVTESPYVGIESVMSDAMSVIGEDFSSFAVNPENYLVDGNTVAMIGRYDATYKSTGKTMTPQVVHVWTLEDGHITGFQQYGDTAAMRDVMNSGASNPDLGDKLLSDYVAAVNSNDVENVMPLMTEDVVFQYSGHDGEIIGAAAVKEWGAAFFAAYSAEFEKTPQDFHLAQDWAVQRYTFSSTLTEKATGDIIIGDGKGVILYQKGPDGKWRVSLDGWSENPTSGR